MFLLHLSRIKSPLDLRIYKRSVDCAWLFVHFLSIEFVRLTLLQTSDLSVCTDTYKCFRGEMHFPGKWLSLVWHNERLIYLLEWFYMKDEYSERRIISCARKARGEFRDDPRRSERRVNFFTLPHSDWDTRALVICKIIKSRTYKQWMCTVK